MTARKGDHYVTDDRTGETCWASDTVIEWTGLRVHRKNVDYRHPQEFVRGRRDVQRVPNPRPEPPDVFVDQGSFDDSFDQSFAIFAEDPEL